jgi:hypothetical protein
MACDFFGMDVQSFTSHRCWELPTCASRLGAQCRPRAVTWFDVVFLIRVLNTRVTYSRMVSLFGYLHIGVSLEAAVHKIWKCGVALARRLRGLWLSLNHALQLNQTVVGGREVGRAWKKCGFIGVKQLTSWQKFVSSFSFCPEVEPRIVLSNAWWKLMPT